MKKLKIIYRIVKYLKKFESYRTGAVSITIDGVENVFTLKRDDMRVYLMKDDEVYQQLDIETPDTKNLDDDEFYMAPDIPKEIVDELTAQGFIDKCEKDESLAGDQKVKAYHII